MLRTAAFALAVIIASPALAAPAIQVPPIVYKARTLPNGLKVYTSLDRTTPNVTVQVWYGVGAKNDPEGRSGFAHLFEHLMFKGTRDLPPESMDRLTEDVGGFNNASTGDDTTEYHEVIPASQLQRLIWAEAERLGSLVVDEANFQSERKVVEEELRQRVLAAPYGRLFSLYIPQNAFAAHPYRRPPIGSIEDLEAASLDDVRNFHATYYRPDNAALIIVGNFDEAQLNGWIDHYLGAIPAPSTPMPKVTTVEPPRTGGPRTVVTYGPNVPLPALAITWLAPAASDPDAPALTVLDALLSTGKSSRLYDSLVYDKQVAEEIFSDADLRAQPGIFYVGAVLASGKTLDAGEAALEAQVAALRDAPVSAAELDEAKTQLVAAAVRARETIDGRANELGTALEVEGDAARANTDIAALQAVTAADVQRVARRYLADNTRVVIRYLPDSQRPAGSAQTVAAPAPPVTSPPYTGPVSVAAAEADRQPLPPVGEAVAPVLPSPAERTLTNGLRVIVAHSTDLPLVSANLTVMTGAASDPAGLAGAASLTADLVTEGTKTRSERQIARETEALGASLESGSEWESSSVTLSVMPQNLRPAMAVMADVAENPAFAPEELERVRKETLDGLEVNLQQPGSVAAFVTAPVIYAGTPFGHVAGGTPASVKRLARADLVALHDAYWRPDNAVLVMTGDITPDQGFAMAEAAFGGWRNPASPRPVPAAAHPSGGPRALAVDLPGTGQAAVVLAGPAIPRGDPRYYPALVANDVLGGGYSARLNEEIRVKRGLSYGASSRLAARRTLGSFTAQAQTKNESAADVVGLIRTELTGLAASPASPDELKARKSSLEGEYGRALATTGGLAAILGNLALYGVDLNEIKVYTAKVEGVSAADVQAVAHDLYDPSHASIIVVGDAKLFLEKLKAAVPTLEVIPIDKLDLDRPSLRAGG